MNLYTNRVELLVLFVSQIIVFSYFVHDYGWKKAIVHTICLSPVLFFSGNMLCEAVTIDELNHYIVPIVEMDDHGVNSSLATQVRVSLIIFGTIFEVIPDGVWDKFTTFQVYQIYKILHYFLVFGIILIASWVWKSKIFPGEKNPRWRLINSAILFGMTGLPISCLLLKTCNYDTYVYFAILGFSLIIASLRNQSLKFAYASVMVTMLGCFEKLTALPYWCIAMTLYIYLVIKRQKLWRKKFAMGCLALTGMAGIALISSAISVIWIKIISHMPVKVSISELFDPFIQLVNVSSGVNKFAVPSSPFLTFILILCVIFIASFVIEGLLTYIGRHGIAGGLCRFNVICLGILTGAGVWASFFVSEYKVPYKEGMGNEYIPTHVFNGAISYYGAETKIGHFLSGIAYAYATIICNYPTVVLIVIIVGAIVLFVDKNRKEENDLWVQLLLAACIWLPVFEVMSGQPSNCRYYAVSILEFFLLSLYFIFRSNIWRRRIKLIALSGILMFSIEMFLYLPNYSAFSPIWAVKTDDFDKTVRKGELRAGEVINWGEDFAIAGHLIKEIIDEKKEYDYKDIKVYSNYTITWLKDPGFQVRPFGMSSDMENCRWDDSEYYVLSKCMLYRCDLPEIIDNVIPVATISYNGEISTWIYRGSQLMKYEEYIWKQMEIYRLGRERVAYQ